MKEIRLSAPSGWNNITSDQLLFVSKLFMDQLPETEFLTRCLVKFTGIEPVPHRVGVADGELLYSFLDPAGALFSLTADEMASLLDQLKWVTDGVGLCKLPEKIAGLTPVDSRLFGVSLEEYLLADQLYAAYSTTKKHDLLNQFAAIFYRKNGDAWDERKYRKHVNAMRSIPVHAKNAVYVWFTGLKKWMIDKYPYLFSENQSGETGIVSPDEHILRLLTALNGGDVTKNKEILRTSAHEVFFELNQKIENNKSHV